MGPTSISSPIPEPEVNGPSLKEKLPDSPSSLGLKTVLEGNSYSLLRRWFPILSHCEHADRQALRGDLRAGLTTAIMLVPQAMAYAVLAGLEPIAGLYAALVPPLIYSLLGRSRSLSVGPVAIDSMLVATSLAPLGLSGPTDYPLYALHASGIMCLVGLIQLILGALRAGALFDKVPQSIVVGFTTGAAVLIAASQLGTIFGLQIPREYSPGAKLIYVWSNILEWNWLSIGVGVLSLIFLFVAKQRDRNFPRFLVVVLASALGLYFISWGMGPEKMPLAIVGEVPSGLPAFSHEMFSRVRFGELLPSAMLISIVSFLEGISVAKKLDGQSIDQKQGRFRNHIIPQLNSNSELFALGAANFVGSWFGGYPVAGGLSRSAVNADAGARSTLAGLITALLVGAALLLLTPLFYFIPRVVLAAIILSAIVSLFDYREFSRLYCEARKGFVYATLTALVVVFWGMLGALITMIGLTVVDRIIHHMLGRPRRSS